MKDLNVKHEKKPTLKLLEGNIAYLYDLRWGSCKQKQIKGKMMLYYIKILNFWMKDTKLKEKQHTGRKYLQQT